MPLLIIAFGVALQVYLTYKKISPFLSLLIVAIVVGLLLGMHPSDLVVSIEKGVGSTLSGLALIICLGAVLGKILEASGAINQITSNLIRNFGERHVQWAVLLTGFLVGLPLYYNAGFIILVPLVFSVARRTGLPLLYIAIPTAASLSATHCFLPPHPGPVVLVNAFNADLGLTLVYGLILVIPIVIIAGPFLGKLLKNIGATANGNSFHEQPVEPTNPPSPFASFIIALMPVLLISLAVVVDTFFKSAGTIYSIIQFFGNPNIALLTSVLLAVYFFGTRRGTDMHTIMEWLTEGISGIAMILLIITAGGVLKEVLIDSGTGKYITSFSSEWQINPYLFAWIITALLRIALGSATVAGLTAAGIVSPLVLSGVVSPELMVLAVGSGSVFCSHINDTGFWMFKEFFNLSLKQTFMSWTVMESLMSVLGLLGILVLQQFV
ncbi:MAG: gluconate:H+ symporter [Cyclobacteriaceae bacterium]|nr:gluconate:H+ symporter [Cyclobacteriaceae bacterium]UYN85766.1 MAG: gluconate:H+ symporter [Cyclobacteriaceae bacterium]